MKQVLTDKLWKLSNIIKHYKLEIVLIVVGVILTIICRNYAVSRRISMGLKPSWGSEYAPIIIIAMTYFVVKSDWSFD